MQHNKKLKLIKAELRRRKIYMANGKQMRNTKQVMSGKA